MTEIRIYVEGGGDSNVHRSQLRQSFGDFFADLRQLARDRKNVRWHGVIPCGSRNSTFDDFCVALRTHPNAFNVLLVDAEAELEDDKAPASVANTDPQSRPWDHLKSRDNWDRPAGVGDDQCFLMVQSMETWLIADAAALKKHFQKHFKEEVLPDPAKRDIEKMSKKAVTDALNKAVAAMGAEKYHKTRDGLVIVGYLDAGRVRAAAASCDRLFTTLAAKISGAQ